MSKYTKKILITDDEDFIRESLEEFISIVFGYEIDTAADGSIAYEKLKKSPSDYGIILTDLKMPNMDGLELIRQAREISEDFIFIILTGYATKENAVSALKHGAYDFVHKPFNVDELTAVFKRAVSHWTLREENKNYQKNLEKLVEERTREIQEINDDLRNLIGLTEKVNKTEISTQRINIFRDSLIKSFKPDTAMVILYDNDNNSFISPWIHNESNSNIILPANTGLLKGKNKVYFSDISDAEHGDIHLNPEDEEFCFARMEHEVFLGYLYLGFKNKSEISRLYNKYKLYITTFESLLFSNYLEKAHQREMEKTFLSGIKVIADTVEANSPFTRKHSDRVEKVVKLMANKLNFSYDRKYLLSIACILHDIGKVGIDANIVYKPEKLTRDEYKLMQNHPVIGAKIVQGLHGYKVDHIVRYHHEWWNGEGYPDKIKGEEIPFESRMISIADAFDSMLTDRPYRKGMPMEAVLQELKDYSGRQFDPDLVEKFLEMVSEEETSLKLIFMSQEEDEQYQIVNS